MALKKDAYLALEDIVGPEFITEDPALLDSYNQVWGNRLFYDDKFSARPGAVLLPGSTDEVQKIVRVCNRYGVTFKPFSSGFENLSVSLVSENAVTLDLRRMDRIIDIDEKNMRAIVEPYVSQYRLQMELAKVGLFVSSISCGPSGGVVAAACCHYGGGATQVFTGAAGRNVLGVEWVLPNGEVITIGSAEAGAGWFSGDGPGLSLRGILRGNGGANGGHGVITKAAVKLYPWYGPAKWEFHGPIPSLKNPDTVLDGLKMFVITFPSKHTCYEANRLIGQAEISYGMQMAQGVRAGEGNDEQCASALEARPELADAWKYSVQVLIGAPTQRAMAYREKALLRIAEQLGGWLIPELNDPKELAWRQLYSIWAMGTIREAIRHTGDFWMTCVSDASMDVLEEGGILAEPHIDKYVDQGAIAEPRGHHIICPFENYSAGGHLELIYRYDPWDEESLTAARKVFAETNDPKKFGRYGIPMFAASLHLEPFSHIVENWSPYYDDYGKWMQKIKAMLDPGNLSDWSAYIPSSWPAKGAEKVAD
jgi:glycolate oxidase